LFCTVSSPGLKAIPAHIFVSVIFNPVRHSIFSYVTFKPTFRFSCQTLVNSSNLLPYSGFQFLFFLGRVPSNLWTLPTFSEFANMSRDDLTSPVTAATTAQVKLCPYDEEESHIWFHLIEAQFAVADIKSQKLKYSNALASLPKQVPSEHFGYFGCLQRLCRAIQFLKNTLLGQFGKSKKSPRSRPDCYSFQNPGNGVCNFTITMPIRLTGALCPVLGGKTNLLPNHFRFGGKSDTRRCHGNAFPLKYWIETGTEELY
jgi:hypothetical protein